MVDINNHIEVNAISESCQILSDTLDLVEKSIFPGQSVLELDKIAENYISSCNAKPAFKGYDGFPATLTVSIDDEIVHGESRSHHSSAAQDARYKCRNKHQ